MKVYVFVPDANVGDTIGDLNRRRAMMKSEETPEINLLPRVVEFRESRFNRCSSWLRYAEPLSLHVPVVLMNAATLIVPESARDIV
jgi:translation elongation factor EF-G